MIIISNAEKGFSLKNCPKRRFSPRDSTRCVEGCQILNCEIFHTINGGFGDLE
jgi:hypothetical protein